MPTPITGFRSPGPGNVFPTTGLEISARQELITRYTRNPNTFKASQYAELRPDIPRVGQWAEMSNTDAVRIVSIDDFIWPDGNDRPQGEARRLRWHEYRTKRYDFPFLLGNITIDNATFDVVADNAATVATQAMTGRTKAIFDEVTTAGSWGTHTSATVDLLLSSSGASWLDSTTTELWIRKSFQAVVEAIEKDTGGAITAENGEIGVVVSPIVAHGMGQTAEVREYVVNHERALSALEFGGMFEGYGIPRRMYGVNIIVENAAIQTNRVDLDAEDANAYLWQTSAGVEPAVFFSRRGGIGFGTGRPGGTAAVTAAAQVGGSNLSVPTLSTLSVFSAEDMNVQLFGDDDDARKHRRVEGHVVDDYTIEVTADFSGYLIGDVTD